MSLYLGTPRCRRFQSRFSKAEALEVHRQVSPLGETTNPLLVERRNRPLTFFRGLELLQQGRRQLRLVLVVTLQLVAKPKGRGWVHSFDPFPP